MTEVFGYRSTMKRSTLVLCCVILGCFATGLLGLQVINDYGSRAPTLASIQGEWVLVSVDGRPATNPLPLKVETGEILMTTSDVCNEFMYDEVVLTASGELIVSGTAGQTVMECDVEGDGFAYDDTVIDVLASKPMLRYVDSDLVMSGIHVLRFQRAASSP